MDVRGNSSEAATASLLATEQVSVQDVIGGLNIKRLSKDGDVVTYSLIADASYDLGKDGIEALDFAINFDPTDLGYINGSLTSDHNWSLTLPNETGASSGTVNGGFISFTGTFTDFSDPIAEFQMTVLETSEPVIISITGTNFDGAAAPDTIKTFSNPLDIDIRYIASNGAKTQMPDQSLTFVSSETDSTTITMSSGRLEALSEDLSFTHVELNNANYDHGISISDVVLQLRDIVGLSTLDGKQKIAADIDGSGEVAISDVVSNLRHIVGLDTIEECALLDSTDALVTSLNSSTVADLTLVQYGDVDLSATFLIA